jgi:hypothetical protein
MPKTQKHPIGNDFNANVVQESFLELFQAAHDHVVKNAFPSTSDGSPRDVVIVDTGTAVYICVKTSRGWFKTASLAAV